MPRIHFRKNGKEISYVKDRFVRAKTPEGPEPRTPEPKREGLTIKCNRCGFVGEPTQFIFDTEVERDEGVGRFFTNSTVTLRCKKCGNEVGGL